MSANWAEDVERRINGEIRRLSKAGLMRHAERLVEVRAAAHDALRAASPQDRQAENKRQCQAMEDAIRATLGLDATHPAPQDALPPTPSAQPATHAHTAAWRQEVAAEIVAATPHATAQTLLKAPRQRGDTKVAWAVCRRPLDVVRPVAPVETTDVPTSTKQRTSWRRTRIAKFLAASPDATATAILNELRGDAPASDAPESPAPAPASADVPPAPARLMKTKHGEQPCPDAAMLAARANAWAVTR